VTGTELSIGSLFSGCGCFDLGFQRAGFCIAWQVEIDRTARSVLARQFRDVQRYEDVCDCGAAGAGRKYELQSVDVICGGFPCQDVSTAGKRKGFEGGTRSSLWFEMARIVRELRPLFVVWENVPGLLSSDEGRAFGWVLRELADLGFDGGWRTVDAQFFGVPQQRRRVFGCFARGDSGAERSAEILALAEGVRRRTPPRRKAGQGVAAALTCGSGSSGVNPPGRRQEDDTNLVVGALQASEGGADDNAAQAGHIVYGVGASGERAVCGALTAKGQRQDFDTENFVLIQDARAGMDRKAQNGIGVRESDVSYTVDTTGAQAIAIPCLAPDGTPKGREDGLAYTLTGRAQRGHGNGMSVCVTGERVTHALTGEGHDASEDGTGRGTPIVATAFAENQRGEVRYVDPAPAGYCGGGKPGEGYPAVQIGPVVRRLTPLECERLMGLPDDWTRYSDTGKQLADGPRYRLCGNGIVVSCVEWFAKRIRTDLLRRKAVAA
jgi:DNA (cytosine-5)-methyltransferase 1